MLYIIFALIIISISGILFFTNQKASASKGRTKFLKELEEYFEAPLATIPDYQDSYSISFKFEGYSFIYEDIQSPGFKGVLNLSNIKGRTNTTFTLELTEKENRSFLYKSDEDKEKNKKKPRVILLPKQLHQFGARTNNPDVAEKFFKDSTMVRIFLEFKNLDSRGRPFMSLKILDGVVILDFHPSGRCHPKPLARLASLELLEDHLDKMIAVMKKLKSLQ